MYRLKSKSLCGTHHMASNSNRSQPLPEVCHTTSDVFGDETKENCKEEQAVQKDDVQHDRRAGRGLSVHRTRRAEECAVGFVDCVEPGLVRERAVKCS